MFGPYKYSTTSGFTVEWKLPGACGPDGKCLTCGRQGDTAGCGVCRTSVSLPVTEVTLVDPDSLGISGIYCGHGRREGVGCPHCLGL